MDIILKIKELAAKHGWTEYRLVKESGLPASTVANIYHRNTIPSIPTLEILCNTFGITLSQFFSTDTHTISLSEEQIALLDHWSYITQDQRNAILLLLKSMQ